MQREQHVQKYEAMKGFTKSTFSSDARTLL